MKKSFIIGLVLFSLLAAFAFNESFVVKGKVVDPQGVPVPHASITIRGTNTGVSADANGEFTLSVPGRNTVIVVSATNYQVQEVKIKDKNYLTIILKQVTESLQEVVVTAMSAEKRSYSMQPSRSNMMAIKPSIVYGLPPFNGNMYNKDELRRNSGYNREGYDNITENQFLKTTDNPLSTFSIDVDAASYSNVRRMINSGYRPPSGAVRIEEMINYFTYDYPQPKGTDPFSVNTEISACPWNEDHRLVSIGLQGRRISTEKLPASNLTFLIDVSGSMNQANKLPLVKSSLKMLVDQLREQDKVSIVVYAGNAGIVLSPTPGSDKMKIKTAIDNLEAGGSTAGGQGIKLAYKTARENYLKSGNNRVVLCTDGDFNVGVSSDDELERMIEDERKSGVFLTVLGYGTGNYQDAKMQKLANKGNGNHGYIDDLTEAKKVLVHEFGGTLFTIAKDVKLQIEFNPTKVQGYRLIGYENRMLAKEDFNNDKKDAGDLGSGHTVTALYEIIPAGVKTDAFSKVDDLKYQKTPAEKVTTAFAGELMNIKLRYKQPDGEVSKLIEHPVMDSKKPITQASENLRFAAAVAQFGMVLRDSKFKGNSSYTSANELAKSALSKDPEGYRKEFIEMIEKARKLKDVAARGDE